MQEPSSHRPLQRHLVPLGTGGQPAEVPVHTEGPWHVLSVMIPHEVPAAVSRSGGQAAEEPSQRSSGSHSSAPRQTVVAGKTVSGHAALVPVQ